MVLSPSPALFIFTNKGDSHTEHNVHWLPQKRTCTLWFQPYKNMYVDEQSLEGNAEKWNSYIRVIWLRWRSFKNVIIVLCYQSIKSGRKKNQPVSLETVPRQIQELLPKGLDWSSVVERWKLKCMGYIYIYIYIYIYFYIYFDQVNKQENIKLSIACSGCSFYWNEIGSINSTHRKAI